MSFKFNIQLTFLTIVYLLLFCFHCKKNESEPANELDLTPYSLELPAHFPEMEIPVDNELTVARVALGKKLFFDPILSIDSTVACATCHLPELAFSDGLAISKGVENRLGLRNSPSLANVGYQDLLFKDGGVPKLALQVLTPIEDENEMDFRMFALIERLSQHAEYQDLTKKAYGQEINAFTITRAIAAFERTLISANSPADRYLSGGDTSALTDVQTRGLHIFFGEKAKCSQCHSGFNFTNNAFINNGLYEEYADLGRRRVTLLTEDIGKFKVPSLRNVAQTAPYMHDGSLANLDEVLTHYENGGSSHPNKSELIRPFSLTSEERHDLVQFLTALTDTSFLENEAFRP